MGAVTLPTRRRRGAPGHRRSPRRAPRWEFRRRLPRGPVFGVVGSISASPCWRCSAQYWPSSRWCLRLRRSPGCHCWLPLASPLLWLYVAPLGGYGSVVGSERWQRARGIHRGGCGQRDSGEAWPAHPLDGLWWGLAGGDHEGPGYLDAAVDRPRLVEPAAPWPAGRRVRRARHVGLRELALCAVPRRAASFLGRSVDGIRLWHAVAFRYRAARGIQRARRLWHRAGAMVAVRTEPSMAFWAG